LFWIVAFDIRGRHDRPADVAPVGVGADADVAEDVAGRHEVVLDHEVRVRRAGGADADALTEHVLHRDRGRPVVRDAHVAIGHPGHARRDAERAHLVRRGTADVDCTGNRA
jgi:hypothetical protein